MHNSRALYHFVAPVGVVIVDLVNATIFVNIYYVCVKGLLQGVLTGNVDSLQKRFIEYGILGGIKVDEDTLMFAVTEKRTKQEIDKLVNIVKEETL